MLTLIVLLPLLGFLLNGVLATQLGGNRVGKRFVTVVGCGLPILSFLLTVKALLDLQAGGYAPLVETAYRWALIGRSSFEVAFYFDRLSAVMTLIVTGVGSVIHVYSVGYMAHDKSLRALLRLPEPVPLLHAAAGAGPLDAGAVRRLGRRRPGLVPADRLLVRRPRQRARRQEGLHRQPHRRRRLPARHVRALPGLRHAEHGQHQLGVRHRRAPRWCRPAWWASCCSSAPPASRRRSRCTCGCPTRWPARRRCRR